MAAVDDMPVRVAAPEFSPGLRTTIASTDRGFAHCQPLTVATLAVPADNC
jgi:hypothetical protein